MTHHLGRALILLGAGALTCCMVVLLAGRHFQSEGERQLDAGLRAEGTRLAAQRSGVVGRLEIPRIQLATIVGEGASERVLARGAGHLTGTAFPGEPGNVALAGHRDTYFRKLRWVRRGDLIEFATSDGTFAYEVDTTFIVPPTRTDLIAPTEIRSMTLVTCYPFHWIGPAPKRFVVRARQLEQETEGEESPGRPHLD